MEHPVLTFSNLIAEKHVLSPYGRLISWNPYRVFSHFEIPCIFETYAGFWIGVIYTLELCM